MDDTTQQHPSADDEENPVEQEEIFMGPEPNPAHASAPASSPTSNAGVPWSSISSDESFSFTYVLEDYLRIESLKVYSPYHSYGGFIWRLLIFPHGNHTKHELSVYLECGGPVQPEPSYSWSRPACFWLHLVHPARRASVGLPEKGAITDMEVARNHDIIRHTAHVFSEKENDWGFLEFAHFILLRPGRYADEDRNVIIRVRIRLDDGWP